MEPTNQGEVPKPSQVIQIDEGKIQEHLGELVRSTVGETLNAMLDAEADRLCRAERYERTEARKDTRAGSYQRHLQTKVGEVALKVPNCASYVRKQKTDRRDAGHILKLLTDGHRDARSPAIAYPPAQTGALAIGSHARELFRATLRRYCLDNALALIDGTKTRAGQAKTN
jgi:hypothetical protein